MEFEPWFYGESLFFEKGRRLIEIWRDKDTFRWIVTYFDQNIRAQHLAKYEFETPEMAMFQAAILQRIHDG